MCGRYNLFASQQEIIAHFQLPGLSEYEISYNINTGAVDTQCRAAGRWRSQRR